MTPRSSLAGLVALTVLVFLVLVLWTRWMVLKPYWLELLWPG